MNGRKKRERKKEGKKVCFRQERDRINESEEKKSLTRKKLLIGKKG